MGNHQEKFACDTLAREITFKQYEGKPGVALSSKKSTQLKRESIMTKSKDDTVYRMPVRNNSKHRKSLKNKGQMQGGRSPSAQRANRILLSDMELECDGKNCRLVPRESLKRKQKSSNPVLRPKRLARDRPNCRSIGGHLKAVHLTHTVPSDIQEDDSEDRVAPGTKIIIDTEANPSTMALYDNAQPLRLQTGYISQKTISDNRSNNNNNHAIKMKPAQRSDKPKLQDVWEINIKEEKAADINTKFTQLVINPKVTEL